MVYGLLKVGLGDLWYWVCGSACLLFFLFPLDFYIYALPMFSQ